MERLGRGRRPQGAGLVARLSGSKHAKRRMIWFLRTLAGEHRVGDACAELEIGESRFFEQRAGWLQEALELLEPRSAGRPAKAEPPISAAEVQSLRKQVRELGARAAAAEVQAELAGTLPHVLHRLGPGKKTESPARRRPVRVPRR
jgi:hypothetical protein